MSAPQLPPFDEAAFLRRLDSLEQCVERHEPVSEVELATVLHGTRRLLEELRAARQAAAAARSQTLIPSPSSDQRKAEPRDGSLT